MKLQDLITHIAVPFVMQEAFPTIQIPNLSSAQLSLLVVDHKDFAGVYAEIKNRIKSIEEAECFQFTVSEVGNSYEFNDPYTVRKIKAGYQNAAHHIIRAMFLSPVEFLPEASAQFGICKDEIAKNRFDNYANDVKSILNIFDEKFAIVADEIRIVDLESNDSIYRECIELADRYRQEFSHLSFYLQAKGRTQRKELNQ